MALPDYYVVFQFNAPAGNNRFSYTGRYVYWRDENLNIVDTPITTPMSLEYNWLKGFDTNGNSYFCYKENGFDINLTETTIVTIIVGKGTPPVWIPEAPNPAQITEPTYPQEPTTPTTPTEPTTPTTPTEPTITNDRYEINLKVIPFRTSLTALGSVILAKLQEKLLNTGWVLESIYIPNNYEVKLIVRKEGTPALIPIIVGILILLGICVISFNIKRISDNAIIEQGLKNYNDIYNDAINAGYTPLEADALARSAVSAVITDTSNATGGALDKFINMLPLLLVGFLAINLVKK